MATDQGRKVAAHWSRLAVTYEGALRSLASRGIAPEQAGANDLHAVDMIHMGGLAATDALAAMAGITAGGRVLDIGSGVGGPARAIAEAHGCRVTGIDLTPAFCDAATTLSGSVGLGDRVAFHQGVNRLGNGTPDQRGIGTPMGETGQSSLIQPRSSAASVSASPTLARPDGAA
ncbi:SAM-dependent methyltransferase [Elioraea sp.]|uniref:SAM-dependent methyltransferase n=1 Tax=Elioraea sp. TaxID=2185103 RepID=UPI003F6F372D